MKPIIELDHVSMRFNLELEKTDTIKEYFMKLVRHQLKFNEFYALRDISFSIKRGEALALIGENGSGKSTILKIIAGVLRPSHGKVNVHGGVAPLIELGAGFDMDMTARENVFLNGAMLGYSRQRMQMSFESIIDFAELQDFVDVPLKNFSSGMIARLGFAIATQVKEEILIVDEILSVGDVRFQKKCHERMSELMSGGTTLLFVSHSMDQIRQICNRAIWLDHGRIVSDGKVNATCDAYLSALEKKN